MLRASHAIAVLSLLASACRDDGPKSIAIQFAARAAGEDFACGREYPNIGDPPLPFVLTDARFYVHDVRLVDSDGTRRSVTLDESAFQRDGLALLDFEDGCGADGTPETHTTLTGVVDAGEYDALEFTLGVPAPSNFIDLASAAPPLDVTGMFWTWKSGYKYLKVDGASPAADGGINPFFLHLGAVDCPGDNAQAPPVAPCASSNIVEYSLEGFDAEASTVVVQIAEIFAESDLASNTAGTGPGCMSEAKDPECAVLLPRLGVDDPTQQHLFALD